MSFKRTQSSYIMQEGIYRHEELDLNTVYIIRMAKVQIFQYLFIYFAHHVTILKRKKTDENKIIELSLMAWQHKYVGITPTNANSV